MIYGSADAGKTVTADPIASQLMKGVAKQLKLAPHLVKGTIIYGPGDIEIHKGTDHEYYVLDFGRVMPAEAPKGVPNAAPAYVFILDSKAQRVNVSRAKFNCRYNQVMFRLLRLASVQSSPKALCSDAFTGWMDPSEAKEMAKRSLRVTKHLFSKTIPEFALWLVCAPFARKLEKFRVFFFQVLTRFRIVT